MFQFPTDAAPVSLETIPTILAFCHFQVRVHAPPDDYNRLDLALRTGVEVLSYYEKLLGEPFPLAKLGKSATRTILII